ncbi:hypothetical protein AJ78_00134 [Emergomyces pasteurianus Ep9510]|uniref:Uncharacterized protein n=1 Tax=Emergomyces pasteurianus Ep9510 TaxID=1447872 RepID=A0A1J9QVQ3_9EURO|nr:hypothetical protein AJ78_00134 [Emergomyces pasteurianus Ep9510]
MSASTGKSGMPWSDPRPSDPRVDDTTRNPGDLEGTTLDGGSRDGERRHISRRHRDNQTSSSFFLEPPISPARTSNRGYSGGAPILPATMESQKKGKRTSDESDIRVPKRHTTTIDRKHDRSLVGSSPLAISMVNASPREEVSQGGTPMTTSSSPSAPPSACLPQSFGLDTDPAQIVNLALNLSDSRRRSASGRVVSSIAPRSTRGLSRSDISTDSYKFPQQDMVDFQRPFPQDQRISSRLLPGSGIGGQASVATRASQSPSVEKIHDTSSKQYEYMPYDISSATLARAEKTRKHFELFEEYLRLLPHLPPLPNQNELSAPAGSSSARDRNAGSNGRIYNPLQYIRNRKVRFREKCPIDSEADGWENLDSVRSWVDLITSSDENPTHGPEHCILLPKLDPDYRLDAQSQSITTTPSTTRVLSSGDSNKPRRPRVDWITSPADFLADAAWLEEGSNKLKIEDRDGKRIFGPDTTLKPVPLRGFESPTEQPAPITEKIQEQSTPLAEKLPPHGDLPSFKPLPSRSHTGADRGRRSHKVTSSTHLSPSGPSSREASKSRWRRALSRSSDSSSESSSDEHGKHRGRRRFPRLSRKSIENENLNVSSQKDAESSDKTAQKPILPTIADLQAGDHNITPGSKTQTPVLPPLDTTTGQRGAISPSRKYTRSTSSSTSERGQTDRPQLSVATVDGSTGSTLNGHKIPGFTPNLSPPPTRPPSPTKSPLSRLVGSGKRLAYDRTNSGLSGIIPADHSATELTPHKLLAGSDAPFDSDTKLALYNEDKVRASEVYHPESPTRGPKHQSQHESRLRGIFKSGRIAEIVGNEVSKVGDYIWKKDGLGHSRQSSAASSEVFSDYVDADDDFSEVKRKQRPHLSRLPTLSDNVSLSRKNSKREFAKYHTPNLPIFVSPPKHDDQSASQPASEFETPNESRIREQPPGGELANICPDNHLLQPFISSSDADISSSRKGSFSFGHSVGSNDGDHFYHKRQASRDRLPVTGLTNLTVTPAGQGRPMISEATRNWSMSACSMNDSCHIDKHEIARVKAHLLLSGIKALEICRQARTIRDSPPVLVATTEPESDGSVPRVPRSEEVTTAARNLMSKFDYEACQVQHAMSKFSSSTLPVLNSRLDDLDTLVTSTLSPRIRALMVEADKLTSELATTNTLALKQLNDSLDKGMRKRRRRFRWVSRVGFVMLEWVLVGAMWWMWLVVMIFKIFKGLWRGTVSGIRWILWL